MVRVPWYGSRHGQSLVNGYTREHDWTRGSTGNRYGMGRKTVGKGRGANRSDRVWGRDRFCPYWDGRTGQDRVRGGPPGGFGIIEMQRKARAETN